MYRNEADTRADLIDPKLHAAGWNKVEHSMIRREVICPGRIIPGGLRGNKLASDYVLIYRGKKLAVVEAKKESLAYSEGVRQAKDYAERLQCRIAYATNGREIYQIDMKTGEEKWVEGFLSPGQLWAYTFDNPSEEHFTHGWRDRFAASALETKKGGGWEVRYYQENAIHCVLEAIAQGSKRILLTMATGTGKTAVAFQIAWKLFQSRWSLHAQFSPAHASRRPRILFLTDRNILADQAVNAFSAFSEDAIIRITPDEIKKHARVPKNGSVFFTIFQTFMQGKDAQGQVAPYFGNYPADFFDFIVVDECHRGGANDESTWRRILDYFSPAVQLGLTATPKRNDNVDTYQYFGEPVYIYTLKRGINDGFLTPFKVYPIVGTMDEYVYTAGDGVVIQGNPEAGRVYRESDFNHIITIIAREEKRVQYWMDLINPHDKTLVFCASQAHAGLVRDLINQYAVKKSWSTNCNYCVRVTSDDKAMGEMDLKIFQDNEKTLPTILTTSHKLSTGVDARNVRNIVLMRPCNNMVEFKQIIGRGTRLFEGKEFFTLFDFVKAHYNFADPEWDGEPIVIIPHPPKPFILPVAGEPEPPPYGEGPEIPEKITIKLNDGKIREIQHISSVMYWSLDGKPVTARQFVEQLFADLPQFFKNENELRTIWQNPATREKLLREFSVVGYDCEKLSSLQCLLDAQNSDIYDVLAYIAYQTKVLTRKQRVAQAKPVIHNLFKDGKQRDFIYFVLDKYIDDGVEELSLKKMKNLLVLRYHTVSDATEWFGSTAKIRATFVNFQKYLYPPYIA